MTGNRVASEDLVQDVFIRMLKYRDTYRGDSRFTTWMYTIARNVRATFFKKHRDETLLGEEGIIALSDASVSAQSMDRNQDQDLVRQALLGLAEEQREILVLARYQGMKYEEIAELMNIATGTVKVRVHRAMNELRDSFMKLSSERKPWNVHKPVNTLRIM
jgi:RNA polymerase sigma-70 factor (ECF subfamily)